MEEDKAGKEKPDKRKSNTDKKSEKSDKRRKRQTKRKERDPDSSSEDESDWRFITTQPAEPFDEVRSQLRVEAEEFQPQAADRELEQGGEEDECPDGGDEVRMGPEVEKEETAVAERESSSDEADEINSERVSSSDEADERDPEPQPATRKYPFQQRNPPKTLTYNTLGQPSVTHRQK